MLAGLPASLRAHGNLLLNSATQEMLLNRQSNHVTPLLRTLQWYPIALLPIDLQTLREVTLHFSDISFYYKLPRLLSPPSHPAVLVISPTCQPFSIRATALDAPSLKSSPHRYPHS